MTKKRKQATAPTASAAAPVAAPAPATHKRKKATEAAGGSAAALGAGATTSAVDAALEAAKELDMLFGGVGKAKQDKAAKEEQRLREEEVRTPSAG
jgi:hypothetical protein